MKLHSQFKHGMYRSPTWNSWQSMKARCLRPTAHAYERYGGRGISICAAWIDSFETFLHDMGERPPNTSLDRIDVNGHYEPNNCRWASRKQQTANQRVASNATLIEFNGETQRVAEWARRFQIDDATLRYRLSNGWPVEAALTTPPSHRLNWKKYSNVVQFAPKGQNKGQNES